MTTQWLKYLFNKLPIGMLRFLFNRWGPFHGAGIKVDYIAPDFCQVDVSMTLRWFNKNYMGVHYGGSIFSMADPFYMLILVKNLGDQYIVWDKAAKIEFKKPGRGTVRARCVFSKDEIASVKQHADSQEKYVFDKALDILNEQGEIVASVVKTLYVRHKTNTKE